MVATRYISSRQDEAASLVRFFQFCAGIVVLRAVQWYSSGTAFSEYAKGGHYKMSKADKRENIIMVHILKSAFKYLDSLSTSTRLI